MQRFAGRLAVRLAIAIMLATTASLAVVVVSQVWVARTTERRLPDEVRARLVEFRRTEDRVWWLRVAPLRPPPPSDAPTLTVQESIRALGRVQDAQWRGVLAGLGLAAVGSIGLAWWVARGVARPIEAVGAAAEALAAGDLARHVAPPGSVLGASSEVVQLTDDFNRMADALERYEAQRTAMVADVAHELRTPLTAMALRLEAIAEGLAPFDAAEVERLRRQTTLLHRLVEDLRVLSLADAGRLDLRLAPVDPNTLATEAAESAAAVAAAKGVSLEVGADPAGGEVPPLVADRDRLAQVLGNLLDNAVRATPEGSRVRLEVVRDAGTIAFRVVDDGPGIAEADLAHVFDRFRQGEHGRRDLRGGSGLGLAIVRTLVEAHGGTVAAANRA
ncbi:MAG: ATP-binding protein, partial [Trueperaceae bacterium]|nr:ATP-binding protein [Trueperaceae bacterium]